jgi:hypothetical protein
MTGTDDQGGDRVLGKPLLQLFADGQQDAAEDTILMHEFLEFSPLGSGALQGTDQYFESEAVFSEVRSHLADNLMRRRRHVRERLVGDETH